MIESARPEAYSKLTEPLPPRVRLLHIGLNKSGTTYIQRAANTRRPELLEHGVRYPGTATSQRQPVLALMDGKIGWGSEGKQLKRKRWDAMMAEVDADTERRIYISNEAASLADDAQAGRFVAALGARAHILVTLRGYAALLPSNWQQRVKSGSTRPFDPWLRDVLAAENPHADHRLLDIAGVITRWSRLVGPDRVTVVVADKARPRLLTDAVCDLLDLPRQVLEVPAEAGGYSANRSMSMPEVEMIRALNEVVRARGRTDYPQYTTLVRLGATARMLQTRNPAPGEPAITLPAWAAEIAEVRSREHADAVSASGCQIIGDVELLYTPVRTVPETPALAQVPLAAAAQALAGVVSAATGRRAFFGANPEAAKGTPEAQEQPASGPDPGPGPDPDPGASRLGSTARPWRSAELNEAYAATRQIPASRLILIAGLRLWRRARRRR